MQKNGPHVVCADSCSAVGLLLHVLAALGNNDEYETAQVQCCIDHTWKFMQSLHI
jgi:hypothetical protein